MRILYITKTLNSKSGWGRYSREITTRMSNKADIVVLDEETSGYPFEKPILRECDKFRNIFWLFVNAYKIRKYAKKSDLIHALDGYPYGALGALASVGLGKPLIINGVGTYSVEPLNEFFKKNLLSWAYRKAKKVLCVSSFTLKEIKKILPNLNNLETINLGVDYNKFSSYLGSGAKNEDFILSVGALKHRKGYHISIPAFAEAKKLYSKPIKYYIVGSQDNRRYFDLLKEIIKKYNLEDSVEFFDNIADKQLIKFYHRSLFFMLTPVNIGNNFEGFGLVFLEASACGKAVIASQDCGAEDAVLDGETGILVPQKDVEKTGQAILAFLKNPGLAEKFGQEGTRRAQEMSWENTIKNYLKIYESALK